MIAFCLKKIERSRLCRKGLPNLKIRLNPKNQVWQSSFDKSLKVSKNGQKINILTYARAIIFCVKKFGHGRVCKGASQNPFLGLNPKSQIWEFFWYIQKIQKKNAEKTHK